MALIGSLVIVLKAGTAEFARDMKKSIGIVNTFSKQVKSAFSGLTGLGTAVSAGGLGLLIKQEFQAIDATGNLAERLGIATEALVGLQHAANIADVSAESLEKSLGLMSTKLGEARSGSKAAQQAFTSIGLNFQELSTIPLDQAFLRISDAIGTMTNANDKAAAAADIFGAKNKEIILLLNKGSQSIRAAMEDAKALGLTFTEIDAQKIEEADQATKRMGAAFSAAGRQLAIELTPAIELASNAMAEFVKWVKANSDAIREWATVILHGAKVVGEIVIAVKVYEFTIGLVAKAIKAATVAQGIYLALSGPKGWLQLAAGAALVAGAIVSIEVAWNKVAEAATNAKEKMASSAAASNLELELEVARKRLADLKKERADAKHIAAVTTIGFLKSGRQQRFAGLNVQVAQQEELITSLEKAKAAQDKLKQQVESQKASVGNLTNSMISGFQSLFGKGKDLGKSFVGTLEDIGKHFQELRKDALAVFEDTRTPAERFAAELENLKSLKQFFPEIITDEVFGRKQTQLAEDTLRALGVDDDKISNRIELPTAALAGSAEAISAVNRFQAQGATMNPQNRMVDLLKQQTEQNQQQVAELRELVRQGRDGGQVVKF